MPVAVDQGELGHCCQRRVVDVTDNGIGDAPMLPELLAQIPLDDAVTSVSADCVYDAKACHAAIAQKGAQAVMHPRQYAHPWKQTLWWAISRATRGCAPMTDRGAAFERSGMVTIAGAFKTKMHCFKRLCERMMMHMLKRHVVGFQVRVALLNHCAQLGRSTGVPVAAMASLRLRRGSTHLAFE